MVLSAVCKPKFCGNSRLACGCPQGGATGAGNRTARCLMRRQLQATPHNFASAFDMKAESAP